MQKITPCLWFDNQAEAAAEFYTSIFEHSRILETTRYTAAGPGPEGSVMTVSFEIDGQEIVALNGGPHFVFTEAVSLQVYCESQEEVDHYWESLGEDGEYGPCGWLKDKFGFSWQIVPTRLLELVSDPATAEPAVRAMFLMQKLDIAKLEAAAASA
jgi:predicted 3-demethylubiquinone-9 3-methyltransferase (glyoxalase superfamily)